jgi:O-methyltransferase
MEVLKRSVQRALGTLGLRLVRIPHGRSAYDYVYPTANYAPWNSDPMFLKVFESIRSHTLVDIYRCWELWSLVGQTEKLEGSILEVGVWRGGTGTLLAKKAQTCRTEDTVYLCDTFSGVVKAGAHDTIYSGGEHSDTSQSIVENLIQALDLKDVRITLPPVMLCPGFGTG